MRGGRSARSTRSKLQRVSGSRAQGDKLTRVYRKTAQRKQTHKIQSQHQLIRRCLQSTQTLPSRTAAQYQGGNEGSATVAFFKAMAPHLTANILTVTFVYCFDKIHQKDLAGEEVGRLTYLWLIVLILLFMLYGLYALGRLSIQKVTPRCSPSPTCPTFI